MRYIGVVVHAIARNVTRKVPRAGDTSFLEKYEQSNLFKIHMNMCRLEKGGVNGSIWQWTSFAEL